MAENTMKAFSSKRDKLSVNYRNCEKCQMCDNYTNTSCKMVEGNISPEGTCSLWALRSMPTYKHKEFYQEEYEKSDRYKKMILDEYNKNKGNK